jgi:hypothetical protein
MSDPVRVISEHDHPAEKAYLAQTYRLNQRLHERTPSKDSGSWGSILQPGLERDVVSDPGKWRLDERDLGYLLDLCWAIDGWAGALHHRHERRDKYGEDISWYERPEAESEIRAFASAVVEELDRRAPDAIDEERLFIEVESYETRLIATGQMQYRQIAEP